MNRKFLLLKKKREKKRKRRREKREERREKREERAYNCLARQVKEDLGDLF